MIQDVTNPGSVNVADEADGPVTLDQCVTVSGGPIGIAASAASPLGGGAYTSTNPGTTDVADEAFGSGLARDVYV